MTAIDAEQFSLRWNNFHNNLTAGFHDLLLGEDLVDVTLAAEGKFVQAHKMVLSVCSPYFKDLFKVNPCKHPIVILKDTGYKELEALLQFMYRGEVNVRQEELAMFLKTAEMLQIKGLTGSDSKKDSVEPSANKTSSNSAPSRTHSLSQDISTHPPPKRKRSEVPTVPSTSTPTTPSQVVDVTPQTPPDGSGNDQAIQDNDFMQMMNPKMEPQDYESEDGLDMMADDSVSHDPLVQQLLGNADGHKGSLAGLGNFVGLPGMKDGNIGQDGGQGELVDDKEALRSMLMVGNVVSLSDPPPLAPIRRDPFRRDRPAALVAPVLPTAPPAPAAPAPAAPPALAAPAAPAVSPNDQPAESARPAGPAGVVPAGGHGRAESSGAARETRTVRRRKRTRHPRTAVECDLCQRMFQSPSQLTIHRRVHTGEKPYQCDVCLKRFTQSCSVVKHKRLHTGERPHECEVCLKRFTELHNLNAHRRLHTGQQPFACDLCLKRFNKSSDLKIHKLNHAGVKAFECEVCQKTFFTASHMSQHFKRTHLPKML